MGRMVAGFVIAPGIPLVAYLIATSKYADETFVVGGLLVFYGLAAVIGIPLFLLCRHLSWLEWWQISLMGGLLPLLVAIAWVVDPPCCQSTAFRVIEAVFFVLMGVVSALCFWLIGLWRNPTVHIRKKATDVA
jgi:hypothetical protein